MPANKRAQRARAIHKLEQEKQLSPEDQQRLERLRKQLSRDQQGHYMQYVDSKPVYSAGAETRPRLSRVQAAGAMTPLEFKLHCEMRHPEMHEYEYTLVAHLEAHDTGWHQHEHINSSARRNNVP